MQKLKIIFFLFISFYIGKMHAQTSIDKVDDAWQLFVDGKPYEIKGVTFGYDKEIDSYDTYFKDLQFLGVNTIRTWATGANTSELLDAAHRHGIKVR